jgi:hypothetical protein
MQKSFTLFFKRVLADKGLGYEHVEGDNGGPTPQSAESRCRRCTLHRRPLPGPLPKTLGGTSPSPLGEIDGQPRVREDETLMVTKRHVRLPI